MTFLGWRIIWGELRTCVPKASLLIQILLGQRQGSIALLKVTQSWVGEGPQAGVHLRSLKTSGWLSLSLRGPFLQKQSESTTVFELTTVFSFYKNSKSKKGGPLLFRWKFTFGFGRPHRTLRCMACLKLDYWDISST